MSRVEEGKCCRLLITPIIVFKGIQARKGIYNSWCSQNSEWNSSPSCLRWNWNCCSFLSQLPRHYHHHHNHHGPGFYNETENIIWSAQPCLNFNELFVYPSKDTSLSSREKQWNANAPSQLVSFPVLSLFGGPGELLWHSPTPKQIIGVPIYSFKWNAPHLHSPPPPQGLKIKDYGTPYLGSNSLNLITPEWFPVHS